MSKWFNAACSALVLASALALSGCDEFFGNQAARPAVPNAPSPLVTSPVTDIAETASAEPGRDRRQWRASSANARSITGNVTTSSMGRGGTLLLASATGITVTAERDALVKATTPVFTGSGNFAVAMEIDPQVDVYLYRVTDEGLSPSAANNGGLCGDVRTTHVAVSEFVGKEGEWALRFAAFRGEPAPGMESDPQLCGTYQFTSQ